MKLLSQSEAATWLRCRRKWWLAYYRRLTPNRESRSGPRPIGNAVHRCLEVYYDAWRLSEDPVDPHDVDPESAMWDTFDAMYEGEEDPDVLKDADLVRAMLEGYVEWLEEGEDEGLEVLGTERALRYDDERMGVTLVSKLDQQLRDANGKVGFLDHKTCGDFSIVKTLHLDQQMLWYVMMQRLVGADEETSFALYNMLRKVKRTARAKPPFYMRFPVYHTDADARAMYNRAWGIAQDILGATERLDAGEKHLRVVYPTPRKECSWECDFFAVCGTIDSRESDAEVVIGLSYREGDPYARYAKEST